MKKLLILTALVLNACTSIRRDDHSYTYIHNFNSSATSEERAFKKPEIKPEDEYPTGDFPQYENGMGRTSAVIDNNDSVRNSSGVTRNHYYPQNTRVASYNPPPAYSGFAPSARRYLIHGETR
jgi:hypothetical protein